MQVRFPSQAIFFLNDDGGASRSGANERKTRALKRVQSTKTEGAKRPRMRARSAKPEGAKRPSRCARMSAANVCATLLYILLNRWYTCWINRRLAAQGCPHGLHHGRTIDAMFIRLQHIECWDDTSFARASYAADWLLCQRHTENSPCCM